MQLIGWLYEGEIYCDDCVRSDGTDPDSEENWGVYGAIFEDSETDFPHYCGNYPCRELLGGALTTHGFKEICREIVLHHRRGDWLKELMEYYNHLDWHVIWTWHGAMDPLGNIKND